MLHPFIYVNNKTKEVQASSCKCSALIRGEALQININETLERDGRQGGHSPFVAFLALMLQW